MKPLIKYPITLFILLLVGYTQVFAHLYWGNTLSAEKEVKQSAHIQSQAFKTGGLEDIYFEEEEEEEDRLSFKKHFVDASVFSYTTVLEYFHQQNISYSHTSKHFSSFAAFQSPYLLLRVFRL